MSPARDNPVVAAFASRAAASARLMAIFILMLRGRPVWRLLSGGRFPALRFFFPPSLQPHFYPQHCIPLRSDFFGTEVFRLLGYVAFFGYIFYDWRIPPCFKALVPRV